VTLLNPDLPKDGFSDRGLVLDVLAKLADGRLIDVEMQMRREEIVRRAVYSVSRLYRSQLEVGDDFKKLKPCIAIVFLAYRRLPSQHFHSTYRLCDVLTGEELCDELEVHFVELSKLPQAHTQEYAREGGLARWSSFLRNDDEELLQELEMIDPRIGKARELLRELSKDPEAQRMVQEREEAQLLYQMELDAAEERGKAEGKAEALLAVLAARGLAVSVDQRDRIVGCSDARMLDAWLAQVASVGSVEELLGAQPAP